MFLITVRIRMIEILFPSELGPHRSLIQHGFMALGYRISGPLVGNPMIITIAFRHGWLVGLKKNDIRRICIE